jgi:C-terminal processing protease CtpA/Prc
MSRLTKAAACAIVALSLVASGRIAGAQSDNGQNDQSGAQVGSQGGANAPSPRMNRQGGDDATLEIAPQPGLQQPRPSVQELPTERRFNPGDSTSSIEPNFRSNQNGSSNRPHNRPSLGITVRYDTECFKGGEEHGLEVLSVDPNSPAERAGIHGPSDKPGTVAAAETIAGMVPILGKLAQNMVETSAGAHGDLIVAIDDQRVRSQDDLQYALNQLKPGDTMYLTVVRPLPGHNHQTLKIAVTLGDSGQPVAANSYDSPPP